MRDANQRSANLEGVVDDPSTSCAIDPAKTSRIFKDGTRRRVPRQRLITEKPAPAKKRGRPPGSKNKPKEAAASEPAPATDAPAAPTKPAVSNGVDPEDSAKERGAYYDDDLSNPNHPLHRPAPDQAVQP